MTTTDLIAPTGTQVTHISLYISLLYILYQLYCTLYCSLLVVPFYVGHSSRTCSATVRKALTKYIHLTISEAFIPLRSYSYITLLYSNRLWAWSNQQCQQIKGKEQEQHRSHPLLHRQLLSPRRLFFLPCRAPYRHRSPKRQPVSNSLISPGKTTLCGGNVSTSS